MKQDFKVKINWGKDGQISNTYSFPTKKERTAFLQGVEEGTGWSDYTSIKIKDGKTWVVYDEE